MAQERGESCGGLSLSIIHRKHGSWLNQAEIEIGLLSRQCLGKDRIASLKDLMGRVKAWNRKTNRKRVKINWKFTTIKARNTFNYYKDNN